eukprot:192033_1
MEVVRSACIQREEKSQLLSANDDNKYDDEDEEDDALMYLDDITLTEGPLADMKSAEMVLNHEYDKKKHCFNRDRHCVGDYNPVGRAVVKLKEIYNSCNIRGNIFTTEAIKMTLFKY